MQNEVTQNFGYKTKVSNQITPTLGHLNEIGTDRKYRGRMMVITQQMTSLSAYNLFLHAFSIFLKDKMSVI